MSCQHCEGIGFIAQPRGSYKRCMTCNPPRVEFMILFGTDAPTLQDAAFGLGSCIAENLARVGEMADEDELQDLKWHGYL